MEDLFFNGWEGVFRVLIVGTGAYFGIIIILRVSGSRTLSQLNAFDFIVTVALGSTLATIILNKDVPLLNGLAAFGILIFLQFVVGSISVRSKVFRKMIKTEPSLLFFKGSFLQSRMEQHRIAEEEILQTLRSEGIAGTDEVDVIVLESNGKFSVIKKSEEKESSVLRNVSLPEKDFVKKPAA